MSAFAIVALLACYSIFRETVSMPRALIGTALSALCFVGWAYVATRVIG